MGDGRSPLEVRLFGELALLDEGRSLPLPSSRKTRALFVYLLLCGKPVRRERLCEIFFDVPDDPRAALRWSLSKARAMLGRHAGALHADRERVWIESEAFCTDKAQLERALAGSPPGDLQAATALAMEVPLDGLDLPGLDTYSSWLAAERADLDRLRARVLALASHAPDLTQERRALLAGEAEALGELSDAAPVATSQPLHQQIRYCRTGDGVRIAFASTGQGPPLVKAANWLNHLELDWTGPVWGSMFAGLSEKRQLIRYDERGNGLSDWDVKDISFEAFVRDLETVVDALGLERFPLLGISQGCAVSIEYAARHPDKVERLILMGGYAAGWRFRADEEERQEREAVITLAQHGWGKDNPVYRQIFSQTFMPSATAEELAWFNNFQRLTASPENAVRFLKTFAEIDVRHRLAEVRCPTLVLHARHDQRVPPSESIYIAGRIPDAVVETLDTDNHIPLSREPVTQHIIDCIDRFLST